VDASHQPPTRLPTGSQPGSRVAAQAGSPHDIDHVAASGSCARCGRALDLRSVKVDGRWYGSPLCATGAPCPLDRQPAAVPEPRLFSRPRRFLRRRLPKELNSSEAR
jgi:hypothetical protein